MVTISADPVVDASIQVGFAASSVAVGVLLLVVVAKVWHWVARALS